MINMFVNEKNTIVLIISISGFLYYTFADGKVLWNGSIFNRKPESNQLQGQLHNKWSGMAAIAMILSLLSSLIIGIW